MMKYNSRGPQRVYHEDETACGPLCQHPACWQSTNRRVKNIPRRLEKLPPPEDIETDLPTVKVCNMLSDYGEDTRDHYPMHHTNQPSNTRATSVPNLPSQLTKTRPYQSTGLRLTAPASTPVNNNMESRSKQQLNRRNLKLVEVQEVFDLEDLNSTWDDTFIAKQYYVWVPNPKGKTPRSEKSGDHQSSISQMNASKKVLVKDMTEDMIPRHYEYERYMQARSADSWPVLKKKRAVTSPTYSMYNRRTPYSSIGNSAHDRTAFETDGIDDLLDLPRDILVKVLDHAKQSDFMSRDRIHEVIERFLPPYDRLTTNMSTASSDLLQQKKMNLHISKARHLRQAHLMETKPVFYLDDDEENIQEEEEEEEEGQVTGRVTDTQRTVDKRFDSDYGSFRDFYFGGMKDFPRFRKPLPAIGDTPSTIPSISLGLPELPFGLRKTRTFTYNKRNYRDVDFTLGPNPMPPSSLRESVEPQDQSEHNSPSQINIQSPSTPKAPVDIPISQEERKVAAEAVQSPTRSATRTSVPLHAVSPAVSTKVPQAPATTPAAALSPTKTFFREPSAPPPTAEGTQADLMISRTSTLSPTQNIRAPMNSPRETSPERTRTGRIYGLGLDTIEERKQEETTEIGAGFSRSRSILFSTNEVPEVPPPPSSPQEDDDRSDMTTPLATPVVKDAAGHVTVLTNQNTVNTREHTHTSFDLQVPVDRKRESTMGSTPEPWPAVNEADFDVTPSSTKLALHSEHAKNGVVNDSRMAVMDPMSDRSSMYNGLKSEDISRNSSATNLKPDEMKKEAESPGPPPPSPEAKDKSRNAHDIPKSGGRRRDIMSRESLTMTPLMEGDEEGEVTLNQGQIKTIVVSVPPLGTAGKPRNKNNRTVDTFVSIDIPAVSVEHTVNGDDGVKQGGRTQGLETTVEESQEDIESLTQTINTREVPLSVMSSLVDPSMDGQDSMSDMMSAGVSISQAGNVSPSSTVPDKGLNIDLKAFVNADQNSEDNGKISERSEAQEKEGITENGGDHEGFKEELREELQKLQTARRGDGEVQDWQIRTQSEGQKETRQALEEASTDESKPEQPYESRHVLEGASTEDSKIEKGQGQSEGEINETEQSTKNTEQEEKSENQGQ
ncbi:uncharacterized protein LOC110464964 isoform X3 [Mizuhopecten yessoensis]|uniref:uncharacterized protein LOC110464964 isoform X3 n=1 Tax=Mizuhopecten yessoensis TaxID=6573 RepID=UPI000B4574E2|nr:uncharacterized protein LOC110464964 isoform X3 [Mizuhopecten yessoensis]